MNVESAKPWIMFMIGMLAAFASGCAKEPACPSFLDGQPVGNPHIPSNVRNGDVYATRFAVIPEGGWIQANVHGFNIRITSKGMFRRCFDWGTGNHCVDLYALPSGKGIGTPGGKDIWDIRTTGARRLLYYERPDDYTEAHEVDISRMNAHGNIIVWRNDGLAVRAHIERNHILVVMVYQIYVDGEKPTRLDGADDNAIQASWDPL